MLIGVDISPAAKKNRTGIEWYCFHIANELAKLDNANQYRFYTKEPVAHEFARFPSNFTEVVLPKKPFWTHTALAAELKANPVDVFYSPAHIIPWRHPKDTVSTIHDAGFRHYRKNYSLYQFLHATVNSYTSAIWAKTVIVPATFVADDITKLYNLKKQKVVVVPNGFDIGEFAGITPEEIQGCRQTFNLGKYFIFVGRMEVRKNLIRTLQAFFDFLDETGHDMQFVLVGSPGVGFDEIDTFIKANRHAARVIRSGYVSARQKALLLAGSEALVFPSLYEGFGIPILEGYAAGTPVITSNTTACPEVAGDAGIVIDPLDVDAIKHSMKAVVDDAALRQSLIARGHERVKLYSWEKTARAAHALLLQKSAV